MDVMSTALRRIILVFIATATYVVGFWPSWFVRDSVLQAFGNPPYQGLWLLIPHVFLYSTLQALFCFVAWILLVRQGWLEPMRFSLHWRTSGWGVAAGFASIAIVVGYFFVSGQGGAFHAPHVDTWNAGANLFSNFFEEYVFRGFILAALAAALGFWPAAVLSSVAFAATHTQYPLGLQATIAVIALLWVWSGRLGGGLLAPYTAHMTLDWGIDPFV
jgi:membrane protease YdiL (CAAX protease family)